MGSNFNPDLYLKTVTNRRPVKRVNGIGNTSTRTFIPNNDNTNSSIYTNQSNDKVSISKLPKLTPPGEGNISYCQVLNSKEQPVQIWLKQNT